MGVHYFRRDFPEYFGTFSKAMLTLFQVSTGDSWVSGITRPIALYYSDSSPIVPVLYFVSFFCISGLILTNVVVAILLEKFMVAQAQIDETERLKRDTLPEKPDLDAEEKSASF